MKMKQLFLLLFIGLQLNAQLGGQAYYTITNNSQGLNEDFAFDSNNHPYFVYSTNGSLTIGKYNGENLENIGFKGASNINAAVSIGINTNDVLYMAKVTASNKITVYKYVSGAEAWTTITEITTTFSNSPSILELAFDNNNIPYVAYAEGGSINMGVLQINENSNTNQVVGQSNFTGVLGKIELDFDSNNIPYLSVAVGGPFSPPQAFKFNGTSWVQVGTIGGFLTISDPVGFAIDSNNVPYVVHNDFGSKLISLKKFDGTNWGAVGSFVNTPKTRSYSLNNTPLDMFIDGNDNIYFIYFDCDNSNKLRIQKYDGNSWSFLDGDNFFSNTAAHPLELYVAPSPANDVYIIFETGTTIDIRRFKVSPNVLVSDATNVNTTSATLPASVSTPDNSAVTARGFVYSSTNTNPKLSGTGVLQKTSGNGSGSFSESVTALSESTTYYFRSYATSVGGTDYSPVKSFTTTALHPVIVNTTPNIYNEIARIGGNITNQGASAVTQRGVVYSSINTNPEIGGANVITQNQSDGIGLFSTTISGLSSNTTYYYKAFATNTSGTSYSIVQTFRTANNALHFDGVNDQVFINHNDVFNVPNGITIDFWVRIAATGNYYDVIYKSGSFQGVITSNGAVLFRIFTNTGSASITTNETISANTWTHVALVSNNTELSVFLNGVKATINQSFGTATAIKNTTAYVEISGTLNGVFHGELDEFRIWNKALIDSEINTLKDSKVPANSNGLIAYYSFDQGVANSDNSAITLLKDSSSNNLDGTLFEFAKTGTTSNFVAGATGSFSNQNYFISFNANTNNNWSNASNWNTLNAPTNQQDILVPSGITATVDVDDAMVNKVDQFGTLNINSGKALTINGNFTNGGSTNITSTGANSGVLFVKGTSTGNVTYERGGLLANKWHLVTAPVAGQKIKDFVENANNNIRVNTTVSPNRYAVAYYDDTQNTGSKWVYYDADFLANNPNTAFELGRSYSFSRATDGAVTFTGTLQTTNHQKTVVASKWNAIGNPFTAFVPVNANSNANFIQDNLNNFDANNIAIYVWDNAQNKYVDKSLVSSETSLAPGQGFFVKTKAAITNIDFNQDKRTIQPATGGTFGKTANTTPSISLTITSESTTVDTDIKYFDFATKGLDPGYDIGNFGGASLDIYTHLLEGSTGQDYTTQSLPDTDYEQMVIPIGVKASKGKEIAFKASIENLPNNLKVYLEDRETNTFTNLGINNKSYKVTLLENTSGIGRFYLHTTSQVLSTDNIDVANQNAFLTSNRNLRVVGFTESQVSIYNIVGKEVVNTKIDNANTNNIALPQLKPGIYLLNISNSKTRYTKKLLIKL